VCDYAYVQNSRRTQPNASNPTPSGRRLTVRDAARELEISEDAVRMRVKRGTLAAEREAGRLYVLLESDPTTEPTADPHAEFVDELRDRVRYLESIITTRDDEIRRRDVIISQLTERIPAIEAPQEMPQAPRESPTVATEQPGRVGPQGQVEGVQEAQGGQIQNLNGPLDHQLRVPVRDEGDYRPRSAFNNQLRDLVRDESDYRPLSRLLIKVVLPTYVFGCFLVWIVALIGAYAELHSEESAMRFLPGAYLGVAWGVGVYAGLRDGLGRPWIWFNVVGLVMAIGAPVAMAYISLVDQGLPFEHVLRIRNVVVMIFASVSAYFAFIFGVMLSRALSKLSAAREAAEREGSRSAQESASSARLQIWVGLAGTIITALFSFLAVIFPLLTGGWR
jgi:hypothetical protein